MDNDINKNKDFWEDKHLKNDPYWLTMSIPEDVYKMHDITNIVNLKDVKLNILEIGIGNGKSPLYLKELGHNVYACDISENAISRIKDKVITIKPDDLELLEDNSINLIICHLVFLHLSMEQKEFYLKHFKRILTRNGFCSIQFADADYNKLNDFYKNSIKNGTHYFMKKQEIIDLIEKNGYIIDYISDGIPIENRETWYIVHFSKK